MPLMPSKSSGTSKVCILIYTPSLPPSSPCPSTSLFVLTKIIHSFLSPFFLLVSGEAAIADPSLPLEITITTDEEKGTLTLRDTGKDGGTE